MTVRTPVRDFQLANPLYKNASVSFYTVANGVKTSTLATLYAGTSGSSQVSNPQKLNSRGQFKQSVYIADQVIGVVDGISVPGHDTAITSPSPTFRVDQSTGKLQYSYDGDLTWNDSGDYIFKSRGAWVTLTAYKRNDTITRSGTLYFAASAHTAGVFATDLAAGKWIAALAFASSALTQYRIPSADAAGLLHDYSTLTFDGTTLTAGGLATGGNLAVTGTSGFTGKLTSAADLKFSATGHGIESPSGSLLVSIENGALRANGTFTATGIITNKDASGGYQHGEGGGVQRITYSAATFNFLTAADANASLTALNATLSGTLAVDGTSQLKTSLNVGGAITVPTGGNASYHVSFGSDLLVKIFWGHGAPTVSGPKGSLYLRDDGSGTGDRAYINTNGTTGWTALTTAA